jgi:hypothetical protein
MTDFDQFERSLAAALRSDADQSIARFEPATVARAATAHPQPRAVRVPRRFTVGPRSNRWAVAAAAVVGLLVIGGALVLIQRGQPSIGVPSPSPSAVPSQRADVAPSADPTPTPSPTPTPILWTQAGLHEDWPAPVRAEPAGGAIVRPAPEGGEPVPVDPAGDTGSASLPWADILKVHTQRGSSKVFVSLADNVPPAVGPTEQWIAYGVVMDDDRDGVPDRRFGIDNLPVTATGQEEYRLWVTDLHTGRTESAAPAPYNLDELETFFDVFWPPGGNGPEGARFSFGADVAGGGTVGGLPGPFYAWAAVIENGRVVATDYAPDLGWLDPNPIAQVESSPSPTTQVSPTPEVENDPDVPGGRLWTVTVVNESSEPATLFVAEEDESGMGRLVGSVTPNVVPPGATVNVTFHLPTKGATGWWIFLNPGPDVGPLLAWTDMPLAGEIHIGADGQIGWLSP